MSVNTVAARKADILDQDVGDSVHFRCGYLTVSIESGLSNMDLTGSIPTQLAELEQLEEL